MHLENYTRVKGWVLHGPDDGTLGWFLGMMFWWRTHAMTVILGAALLAALSSFAFLPLWIAPFAAIWAGIVGGGWVVKISPKYEVTQNY